MFYGQLIISWIENQWMKKTASGEAGNVSGILSNVCHFERSGITSMSDYRSQVIQGW